MASRFYTPPSRPADPGDIHPAWCACRHCPTAWDAAHRPFFRLGAQPGGRFLIGLTLAIIAAGVIAVLTTQVPA